MTHTCKASDEAERIMMTPMPKREQLLNSAPHEVRIEVAVICAAQLRHKYPHMNEVTDAMLYAIFAGDHNKSSITSE